MAISDERFGELFSDVKNIDKTVKEIKTDINKKVDDVKDDLKDSDEQNRRTHADLYNKIGANGRAIAALKAVGAFIQIIFAGFMAWLWKSK